MTPRIILETLSTAIEAVRVSGAAFRKSAYRLPIDVETLDSADRTFRIEAETGANGRPMFGRGERRRSMSIVVRVVYSRAGGSVGDRRDINDKATTDLTRIANAIATPSVYANSTTGICAVTPVVIRRASDFARSEIWESQLNLEWQRAWPVPIP